MASSASDPRPPSFPSNTSPPSSSHPMPSRLAPLLLCPVCAPPAPLVNPTTLRCGHSVCARHVTALRRRTRPSPSPSQPTPVPLLPSCPIPTCAPPKSTPHPNIPSSSAVAYHPAPQDPNPVPALSARVAQPKLDVTINKLIVLLDRTQQSFNGLHRHDFLHQPPPLHSDDISDIDDPSPTPSSAAAAPPRQSRDPSPSERPRKRRRRLHHPSRSPTPAPDDQDDLLTHLRKQSVLQRSVRHDLPLPPPPSSDDLLARFDKELLSELTCEICFMLFYQPITTPCQHTFCAKCLHRSLDHSASCPLCRQDLPGFLYFQDHPNNKVVLSLILKAFPIVYKERGETIEAEERDARLDTPIFVCQLSFPGMPTLLHFFEPRYRLMLRRCLESPNPRFGMVMPPKAGAPSSQSEYGTMLEIRSVQMLPDGRSMVETWGTHRFRILERGTLDGYMVGRIEQVEDFAEDLSDPAAALQPRDRPGHPSPEPGPSTPPDSSPASRSSPEPSTHSQPPIPTNDDLMATCRSFLDRLQRGTAPWVVQRLSSTYGVMPTDASSFSFWVALVLPIDEHEKAKLLPIRSVRLRLLLVVHWIEQLNNNWYAWLYLLWLRLPWTSFFGRMVWGAGLWTVLMALLLFFARTIGGF